MRYIVTDGTEHFRSESIHCPECMEYHVNTKEGVKIQYVHRIVIMYVVGRMPKANASAVQVILGAEPTYPKDVTQGEGESGHESGHEGESTAAKRLVENMIAL